MVSLIHIEESDKQYNGWIKKERDLLPSLVGRNNINSFSLHASIVYSKRLLQFTVFTNVLNLKILFFRVFFCVHKENGKDS